MEQGDMGPAGSILSPEPRAVLWFRSVTPPNVHPLLGVLLVGDGVSGGGT